MENRVGYAQKVKNGAARPIGSAPGCFSEEIQNATLKRHVQHPRQWPRCGSDAGARRQATDRDAGVHRCDGVVLGHKKTMKCYYLQQRGRI